MSNNIERYIERECKKHGLTGFILENRGYYRCKACRKEATQRRRIKLKYELVKYAGGSCKLCGYDRFAGALDFHHLDPNKKDFGLAHRGLTRSLEDLKKEADKCVMLCSNCHRELHAGIVNFSPIA